MRKKSIDHQLDGELQAQSLCRVFHTIARGSLRNWVRPADVVMQTADESYTLLTCSKEIVQCGPAGPVQLLLAAAQQAPVRPLCQDFAASFIQPDACYPGTIARLWLRTLSTHQPLLSSAQLQQAGGGSPLGPWQLFRPSTLKMSPFADKDK